MNKQNDKKKGKMTLIHWAVNMFSANHNISPNRDKCVVVDK